jgi:hypothetical protein
MLGSALRSGRVVAVHGSVIDIAFDGGMLPAINDAVAVDWDRGPPLVAEVQQHLGPAVVRALGSTAGLRRGTSARGAQIARLLAKMCWDGCSTRSDDWIASGDVKVMFARYRQGSGATITRVRPAKTRSRRSCLTS